MQLTQIEAAFKCLKSDLGIRPIYHQLEHRVEAHLLIAFLAYCLTVTLKHRLPTTDGRRLVMPRYTAPNPEQALLLRQMNLVLAQQPSPPITPASLAHARPPTQNVVDL
jgi:hypothetical protein